MANIPIRDIASTGVPSSSSYLVFDDGASMKKTTVGDIADGVRPVASQSEAQDGADNTKTMTALRTKQHVDARLGSDIATQTGLTSGLATKANTSDLGTAAAQDVGYFATAAQGVKADSAVQPGSIGTAAAKNVGTLPNDVVQLDGSGRLPAVDGSLLLGLPGGGNMVASVYDPSLVHGNSFDGYPVSSRTVLKAVDTSNFSTVFLNEVGREGVFAWRNGDYSALVAADTLEGIYVKATAVSASVGAWVRIFNGPTLPEMFGAKGDNATNDAAAINKAIEITSLRGGGDVHIGAMTCYIGSTQIKMRSGVKLYGLNFGSNATGYVSRIRYNGAAAPIVNNDPTKLIVRPVIQDLLIEAPNCTDYVIDAQSWSYFQILDCWLYGGGGGGIRIRSYVTSANITAVTKANPAVVTAAGHPFVNGQEIYIASATGMTEINDRFYTIANATSSTFELSGVNSSGYGTYTGSGVAKSMTTDPTYDRIMGNQIGNVLLGIVGEDNANSGPVKYNRIQPLANGQGIRYVSDYKSYPNNVKIEDNWIETSNANVTGIYVGSTCHGVTCESNRLELPGAGSTGITIVPGADDVTLDGNTYSIPNGTKLSDDSNIAKGPDDALKGARVQIDGATGNMIANSNFNVSATAIQAGTPGYYTISFAAAIINTTRFTPHVIATGAVFCEIVSFSTTTLEVKCYNNSGAVTAPTKLYISL